MSINGLLRGHSFRCFCCDKMCHGVRYQIPDQDDLERGLKKRCTPILSNYSSPYSQVP